MDLIYRMKQEILTSRVNVYDIDDYKNLVLINFVNSFNCHREGFEVKVKLEPMKVFDLVKSLFSGGDALEFNFFASNFYIKDERMLASVYYDSSYDRYGNELGSNGKYNFVFYSPDFDHVREARDRVEAELKPLQTYSIVWSFSDSSGGINTKEIFIEDQPPLHKEFYPWLDAPTVQDYFKSYLSAPESILLLIGVPGTGKTTFIRNMITENRLNTDITYDEKLIRSDSFFLRFINDQTKDVMVIEDADDMLYDREKDDNFLLKKILNISDGLVKNATKKIVFSTNITDLELIDPALIRPGRCFDVLDFRKLTGTEAQAVADLKGINRTFESGSTYTLAEIFSANSRKQVFRNKKVGF